MDTRFLQYLEKRLAEVRDDGLFKDERQITSPQQPHLKTVDTGEVINLCANNYLGLANHPDVIKSAKEGLDTYGFGMASVRFICGTQTIHKELEGKISQFLQTDDTLLYSSCFDANGGLFETLLGAEDAVISDTLNHASIIDGIRLSKAARFRYLHNDMDDLEAKLIEAKDSRFRLIATDGVFSMDGSIANLSAICDLADRYNALVMVDDCHATGILGQGGRGSIEHCNVMGRVDIITSTLGKALGGASGGFTSGKKAIIDWLRQRSRPYLFSNALSPNITFATLKVMEMINTSGDLRDKLAENSRYFRKKMKQAGFDIVSGEHPIVPIMLGDALLAKKFAEKMLEAGVYVIGFSYPVVPKGTARIRTQMSAAHSPADLDKAVRAFIAVGSELGVLQPK